MIKPSEFAHRWAAVNAQANPATQSRLVRATESQLSACKLPEDSKRFLIEAGLPDSCAPFLTFEEVGRGAPRLWDVYSPGQWTPEQKTRVASYRMIGGDGGGEAICLDESANGTVVLVLSETLFSKASFWSRRPPIIVEYINASVPQLAESLLCYALSAISDTLPSGPCQRLESELRAIDETAFAKGSFWDSEVADLKRRAK